jgi:hypothetical protein
MTGQPDYCFHQKMLQEKNDQDDNYRRKINACAVQGARQYAAQRPHYRFGYAIQEDDNFIIGVGIHPGDHRAKDYNPHVKREGNIDDLRQGDYKITQNKHNNLVNIGLVSADGRCKIT